MLIRRFTLASVATLLAILLAWTGVVRGEDGLWQTDFAAAKTKAKAENKLLLVDFTGSDWCGWCMKLASEVFSKDAFKNEAPKKFVLVELDYPREKKQSDELKKQNKELQAKYQIHGYPTILVLDPEGVVVAKTGYQAGGAEKYVKHLAKFVEVHDDVVKRTKELAGASGLNRAKLLDKLIDDYIALNNESDDVAAWDKEIVKLDADNKAGLKNKHEFRVLLADANELREKQQLAEARTAIDKALAVPDITAEQKQDAYMARCECCFGQGDFVGVVASSKKGVEAVPDSEQAEQFKQIINRFGPMAEAQETIVKLKAELPKLKGLDRAKTLDKLIEAWDKVGRRSRDVAAEQIAKWSREIVTLDPDNKAGLKVKYEFRNQMAEANKLRGNPLEYRAAVEKALALPGLGGEQIQSGHFILAVSYLYGQDATSENLKHGLEHLHKALDAAPHGQLAAQIKQAIPQIKRQLEQLEAAKAKKPAKPKNAAKPEE